VNDKLEPELRQPLPNEPRRADVVVLDQ